MNTLMFHAWTKLRLENHRNYWMPELQKDLIAEIPSIHSNLKSAKLHISEVLKATGKLWLENQW